MSTSPLALSYEPEELTDSPIELAVVQVQYPTIMSIPTNEALLAAFQERVRDLYPFLSVGPQGIFTVSSQNVEQQPTTRVFQFMDINQRWTVTLSADSIALETRNYTTFSEFSNRLLKILAAANEVYSLRDKQRLGLRYINEIRHKDTEATEASSALWNTIIRPEVLGILSTEVGDSVDQSVQELSLTIRNGKLTMRHGAFPQGTSVAPLPNQSVLDDPFYLLDFDAFDDRPSNLDVRSLSETLRDYNRSIFSLFRWSLQDEYYQELKGHG
jgi:uncharacterized protein (TIGR04255 family)